MKILVINSGSSSLKFQLIQMPEGKRLIKGLVDAISLDNGSIEFDIGEQKYKENVKVKDHDEAIRIALDSLLKYKIISNLQEIAAIGHRVVHGGEHYSKPALIDDALIQTVRDLFEIAPLHNPPNLAGILACQKALPNVKQVAVFDTAFHQTIPKEAYMYGLPYEYYEKYKIRKYGFHGTSHKYVAHEAARILMRPLSRLKLITCHLGNGSSLAAISKGVSVDTSMGFTPLDGIIMGTRTGELDPAVPLYIMNKEKQTPEQMETMLNKSSGLKGISGVSSDMRTLLEASPNNPRAQLAIDLLAYKIKKFIGAYYMLMDGLDAVIFTAGIGENVSIIRSKACSSDVFNIDEKLNKKNATVISKLGSKVKVLVIPTNEELQIAKETAEVIG